jgi:CheY-like chemotaxis protein
VRDNGIGIPADMLASVFDLFTQGDHSLDRSEGGLGIGLTLVRRLVNLHGGSVAVTSDGPSHGSEFTVRLPLATDRAGEQNVDARSLDRQTDVAAPAADLSLRVLVVDDNVDGADSLARLLRLDGHDVRMAHDGPAALTIASEFLPEAVVLDLGLPGMDGFEVARRLRRRPETCGAVLVAVTGYGRDEDRFRSREAGLDEHFVKPVDVSALRALLADVASTLLNGTERTKPPPAAIAAANP